MVSNILREPETPADQRFAELAQRLAWQVNEQLPHIVHQLLSAGHDPGSQPLHLECSLTTPAQGSSSIGRRLHVTALDLGETIAPYIPPSTERQRDCSSRPTASSPLVHEAQPASWGHSVASTSNARGMILVENDVLHRPAKRARRHYAAENASVLDSSDDLVHHDLSAAPRNVIRKRVWDNPALQPSTLDKFVHGVWDSLYSGVRMDPAEVIEQWQAIESSGQPRLITSTDHDATAEDHGAFGRMNILTRKISQTSKTCRSLEVIVQAHWVQCFDDRVAELSATVSRDKARKAAIAQACVDFSWSEKELRNKMAIWRGYHDIRTAAGWAALVFAGTGLYRFCKYRIAFKGDTFDVLRGLRHRFEVAADTLHPRWRLLLGIVGSSTEPQYRGHPHDWVVCAAGDTAIPLAPTYYQWHPGFTYKHIDKCVLDEEAWDYDPRSVLPLTDPNACKCQICGEQQADDPRRNSCKCYPNLYGSSRAGPVPIQIFRTPEGKNNGLVACLPIEKGWAVGEFVGQITTGLKGLDVMIGQNGNTLYQIWQGKQGNHTRFVNHSCKANSQYERFVWLGKQCIVLASLGIKAGDEITVDYGDTYWNDLDKECKCGEPCCRYKNRNRPRLATSEPPLA